MSIFKETFHPNIQQQIETRQNANERRDSKSIQYLHSRNAWIRMTSAVTVNGSDALAQANILLGGVLNNNNLRAGVGAATSATAYSTTTPSSPHRLGMRPMPGITGIEVKSKSNYGSLREAIVSFTCWDIKQLEELELLYMRPGYTALLEWGWTPYLDNSGNISSATNFVDDVLDGGVTKEQIWENIFERSKVNGNYDAMYGKVQKYNWKARSDGGYDCTTTIITIGEVLESLKVNYGTSDTNLSEQGLFGAKGQDEDLFKQNGDLNSAYIQSKLAGMLAEIWYVANKGISVTENIGKAKVKLADDTLELFKLQLSVNNQDSNSDKSKSFTSDDNKIYIRLRDFVYLLNKYILLYDESAKKPFVEVSVDEGKYRGGKPLLCIGNKLQFSTDPTVCLIKNLSPEALDVLKGVDIRKDNNINIQAITSNTSVGSDSITNPPQGPITRPADFSIRIADPQKLDISEAGIQYILKNEGFYAKVYDDSRGPSSDKFYVDSFTSPDLKGYPTIGYGKLINSPEEKNRFKDYLKNGPKSLTEQEGLLLVKEELDYQRKLWLPKIKKPISQNMYDALAARAFNCGPGWITSTEFQNPTIISLINQEKYQEAAVLMEKEPITSKKVVLDGLIRRRKEEAQIFLS